MPLAPRDQHCPLRALHWLRRRLSLTLLSRADACGHRAGRACSSAVLRARRLSERAARAAMPVETPRRRRARINECAAHTPGSQRANERRNERRDEAQGARGAAPPERGVREAASGEPRRARPR